MREDATAPRVDPSRRSEQIEPGYSAGWHIARTLVLASAIAGFSLWLARSASAWDWLLMPAFFLVANFIEWAFHRGPMHRPMGPRIFYKNHALLHHGAFHHDSMPIREPRELGLVMMPWYTMLLLFALASPVAIVAGLLRGPGAAGIFFLTAAGYFLLYETLHAVYHLPPEWLRKVGLGGGVLAALSAHHRHHHRLDRMAHVNFNVTFPIMDTLLRTKETEAEAPPYGRKHPEPASAEAGGGSH